MHASSFFKDFSEVFRVNITCSDYNSAKSLISKLQAQEKGKLSFILRLACATCAFVLHRSTHGMYKSIAQFPYIQS